MLVSGTALAQQPEPAGKIKIEVTGSNIKRIEAETALPVQVITREELRTTGIQTTQELLDRISANQSFGNVVPAIGEGSSFVGFAAASLRGLGSSRSLVLLNGRRIAPYALSNTGSPSANAVDLNAIPISAIERVEVLKDGASAIYGTDAIGGVINFILRKDYRGAEAEFTYLESEHGGGADRRVVGTLGFGDLATDRYNAFLTIEYDSQLSLRALDRQVSKTAFIPYLGVNRTSGNSIPANITNSASFPGTKNPAFPGCLPPFSISTAPTSNNQCRFDFAATIDTLPPADKTNVIGKVTWQLAPDHQAFLEGQWYEGDFIQRVSPTPVSAAFTHGPVRIQPNNPFYPAAFITSIGGNPTLPVNLSYRALEFGPRTDEAKTYYWRGVAGLQGVLMGWDYQAAFNYTKNQQKDYYTDGYLSEARFLPLLNGGALNPFGFNTPAALAAAQGAKILGLASNNKAKNYGLDAKASNEIWQLPAGPMAVAVGGEWRKEELQLINSDFLNSGDIIGGLGTIPSLTSSDRDVYALFGELNIPIVKTLEGNVAVRYDHYSDVGNTTNPKLSLRWQPAKTLLLRGSYGKGFRAPTLSDLFQPTFITNTNNSWSDPIRCPVTDAVNDCNIQFNSQRGGNPSLKPERSTQWNGGVVWDPIDQVSIGVDYFWVEIKDVITVLDASVIFGNFATYAPNFVVRKPPDPVFPNLPGEINYVREILINASKQQVSGFDVDLTLRQPTPWGKFVSRFTGTYLAHYKQTPLDSDQYQEFVGTAGQPQGALSRWRHYWTIDWEYGPWGLTAAQNFQNGYTEFISNAFTGDTDERRVGSYEIYDLQGRYTGFKNVTLRAGIRNIFDRAPPVSGGTGTFQVGYDASYGDPRGRMYYGSINVSFK